MLGGSFSLGSVCRMPSMGMLNISGVNGVKVLRISHLKFSSLEFYWSHIRNLRQILEFDQINCSHLLIDRNK